MTCSNSSKSRSLQICPDFALLCFHRPCFLLRAHNVKGMHLPTCKLGKRLTSAGAHWLAMRSSSACTNCWHCSAEGSRRLMARRTNSSKGASGMSRLPFTPPLFLIAVLTSSSVSSLQPQHHAFGQCHGLSAGQRRQVQSAGSKQLCPCQLQAQFLQSA